MSNNIKNIKPQYSESEENVFNNKAKKVNVKKEISNLSKIIEKGKKLREDYFKNRVVPYAY